MKEGTEYLTLARIIRPRGNVGEVAAENLAGGLRSFNVGRSVQVVRPNGETADLTIAGAWEHKGRLILHFTGIASIGDAERLRLAEVRAKRTELGPPPEGEYYFDDLVGCRLVDEGTGREMGTVAEVYDQPGGAPLFSVLDCESREMLVPFANEICREVDIESKRIVARLPEGMEDLKG